MQEDEEEDPDETSAFYLKHQNQALASELHQFKFNLLVLEKERQVRRLECRNIHTALKGLNSVWVDFEERVKDGLGGAIATVGLGGNVGLGGDVGGDLNGDMDMDDSVSTRLIATHL